MILSFIVPALNQWLATAAHADPVTLGVVAGASVLTAATSVTVGALNYVQSSEAAAHARDLANQQADQLRQEQQAAREQAAAQAVSGQTFGFSGETVKTGFGFGTGDTHEAASAGRGTITGMG